MFGMSEGALRSPGAAASVLTVVGTWWLGRRLCGPTVGLIAASITAVAPLQVQAAQEARMYPLLGLLTLASWASLLAAIEGKRWAWAAYAVATALSLYTHYFALLNIVGQAVFIFGSATPFRRRWLVSLAVAAVLYLPWVGVLATTYGSMERKLAVLQTISTQALTSLLGLLSFGGSAFGFQGYFDPNASSTPRLAALLPFLVVMGVGVAALRRNPRRLWLLVSYLAVPVILTFIFSLRQNVFFPRYFSFVLPAYALILSAGMVNLGTRVSRRAGLAVTLGLLAGFVAVNGLVLKAIHTDPKLHFQNWREVTALLHGAAGPQDLILVIPAYLELPFTYYFRGSQRVIYLTPRELLDGTSPGPADETRSRQEFVTLANRYPVLWIVSMGVLPPTADARLTRLLAGLYDNQGVGHYNGISVFRFRRLLN